LKKATLPIACRFPPGNLHFHIPFIYFDVKGSVASQKGNGHKVTNIIIGYKPLDILRRMTERIKGEEVPDGGGERCDNDW
jgi:hypothetical protein